MQCNDFRVMGSPLAGVALGVGILAQGGPQRRFGVPWWGWILLLGLVIVLGVIWVLREEGRAAGRQEAQPEAEAEPETAPAGTKTEPISLAVEAAPSPPVVPDDLKRIEGIGPKISGILQAAGIVTFAQLAQADVGRLREILSEAGITHISDPATWPEQARLAAASDWARLEALQDKLKGGRRLE
jgi:predicted flap endonuclease-1-like 5' DNA nuclease